MFIFTYTIRNDTKRNLKVEAETKQLAIKAFFEHIAECFSGTDCLGSVNIINILDFNLLETIK